MSSTSRNKNLVFIIAALLLTNIAVLVYFLWIKKPEHPPKQAGKDGFFVEMLQKEVGFNDQQIDEYKKLKEQQKQVNKPMYGDMRKVKDSLFRLMGDANANDSLINRYAEAIGQKQKEIDLQAFTHFKQIRALCTSPEQAVKYDSAVLQMFRKIGKPPAKKEDGKDKEVKK